MFFAVFTCFFHLTCNREMWSKSHRFKKLEMAKYQICWRVILCQYGQKFLLVDGNRVLIQWFSRWIMDRPRQVDFRPRAETHNPLPPHPPTPQSSAPPPPVDSPLPKLTVPHTSPCIPQLYTVKKVIDFPVPSLDVTNQTLPGREKFHYSRQAEFG